MCGWSHLQTTREGVERRLLFTVEVADLRVLSEVLVQHLLSFGPPGSDPAKSPTFPESG